MACKARLGSNQPLNLKKKPQYQFDRPVEGMNGIKPLLRTVLPGKIYQKAQSERLTALIDKNDLRK
ncbi:MULTISPECIES: hypothetical protein [Oscillatoriales]|uniref:hypothetical protein n=1 Tax=Oscillatoriophycideae TaxID=1301283 RepID=UPI001687DDAA|nr:MULTISPECIES: hypothetical protein [Oscillatoriales]